MGTNPWEGRLSHEQLSVTLTQLPSSYYWGRILEQQLKITTLNQLMQITMPKGILFVGPEGNGKHTTAEALLEFLRTRKAGPFPAYIWMNGAELDEESEREVLTSVDALLRLTESCGRICFLLEDLSACRHGDKVQLLLARRLMRLTQSGTRPWFLVLIAEEESAIHPQLRRQLQICRCPNPNQESRRIWLEQRLKTPIVLPIQGLHMDKLVEATDQFSWHQLTDFYEYLKLLLKIKLVDSTPQDNRELALMQGSVPIDMSDVLHLAEMVRGKPETVPQIPAQIQPLIQYVQTEPTGIPLQAGDAAEAAQPLPENTTPHLSDEEYINKLKNGDELSLNEITGEMTFL